MKEIFMAILSKRSDDRSVTVLFYQRHWLVTLLFKKCYTIVKTRVNLRGHFLSNGLFRPPGNKSLWPRYRG